MLDPTKNSKVIQNSYFLQNSSRPHSSYIQSSYKLHTAYKDHTKLMFHTNYIHISYKPDAEFLQSTFKIWLDQVCINFVFLSLNRNTTHPWTYGTCLYVFCMSLVLLAVKQIWHDCFMPRNTKFIQNSCKLSYHSYEICISTEMCKIVPAKLRWWRADDTFSHFQQL